MRFSAQQSTLLLWTLAVTALSYGLATNEHTSRSTVSSVADACAVQITAARMTDPAPVTAIEAAYGQLTTRVGSPQPAIAMLEMQSSGLKAKQGNALPTTRPPSDRMIRKTDLRYLGAFRLPAGSGTESYKYGGTAIAYHAKNNSLFVVGHDHHQRLGEVSIPELRTGDFSDLALAKAIQPLHEVLGRIPRKTLEGEIKIGGTLVYNGRLLGTAYEYYDANQNATGSHFTFPGTTLAEAPDGFFKLGNYGAGYVAGYMASVPPEWQARLGGQAITGQAGISIIGRTSVGPAAFALNPRTLGPKTSLTPLVYYTLEHPLAPPSEQSDVFNLTSDVIGAIFPEGTASLLFFGRHGTGPYWYGEADGKDPAQPNRGSHAPPYAYYVWHYDARQLQRVAKGEIRPWDPKPETWTLDLPFATAGCVLGGACWDADHRRLFVTAADAGPSGECVVHVFELT